MFNNPFDSFHDTVAEAKEEREQLDRLLTISTPRERLLVAVIALILLVVAAWLCFGRVAVSVTVDGVVVGPAAERFDGNRPVEALVWAGSDIAPRIEAGMPAVLQLTGPTGAADTLRGTIATIAAVPLSGELAQFESAAPVSLHRVGITLDDDLDFASLADRDCRIVIELDRQPPVALFGTRRQ